MKRRNVTRLDKTTDLNSMGIAPYQEKRGEEYMNKNQLAHIEHILHSLLNVFRHKVDDTIDLMRNDAQNFPDVFDRATQDEEFSLELRAQDRYRKLTKKIEDALERLRHPDFGYCEACGMEIGLRRLEARPTATLCVECKTLSEIKEKQNQGG